jgi:hypothetical protein
MSGEAAFWLCAAGFVAGYCVGEAIRLVQEIRRYRAAKARLSDNPLGDM